jgi:hypothetical protein
MQAVDEVDELCEYVWRKARGEEDEATDPLSEPRRSTEVGLRRAHGVDNRLFHLGRTAQQPPARITPFLGAENEIIPSIKQGDVSDVGQARKPGAKTAHDSLTLAGC